MALCCGPGPPTTPWSGLTGLMTIRHRPVVARGSGSYLSYLRHCLLDNRHGLVVASKVTPADGDGCGRHWCGSCARCRTLTRRRWEPTRVTTPGTSSLICASLGSRRMWHRTCRPADRAGVWLDQAGSRAPAAQDQRPISGGSGVSAAWGGPQATPPGQPALPTGGVGMKQAGRGDRGRFGPLGRPGRRAAQGVRSGDRQVGHEDARALLPGIRLPQLLDQPRTRLGRHRRSCGRDRRQLGFQWLRGVPLGLVRAPLGVP